MARPSGRIMTTMNSATAQDRPQPPAKAPPRASRLVLVSAGRDDELVRRYRLARLRLEAHTTRGDERFAHLKQFHD
jgi:hypothetical protein